MHSYLSMKRYVCQNRHNAKNKTKRRKRNETKLGSDNATNPYSQCLTLSFVAIFGQALFKSDSCPV